MRLLNISSKHIGKLNAAPPKAVLFRAANITTESRDWIGLCWVYATFSAIYQVFALSAGIKNFCFYDFCRILAFDKKLISNCSPFTARQLPRDFHSNNSIFFSAEIGLPSRDNHKIFVCMTFYN